MKTYHIVYHSDCGTCRYFKRHYIRWYKNYYMPMDYGHCRKHRVRRRHARECCPDWTSRVPEPMQPFLPEFLKPEHPPKERKPNRPKKGRF